MAEQPVTHTVKIELHGLPEVLAGMAARVSRLLESEAEAQSDPRVARALRKVAADFESGLSSASEASR